MLDNQNHAALNKAIHEYFDMLYNCDLDLFDKVFHPSASLFDADTGRIFVDPIVSYRDSIFRRNPPAKVGALRQDKVIAVDALSDSSANVKVRVRIHNNIFVDHLMFAKEGEQWRIVAKLWHLETVVNE
jgi:hypothetical protein